MLSYIYMYKFLYRYHYIHHANFECNYGSPFSAFIDQYFGTFREKLGESEAYSGEAKHIQNPDAEDKKKTSGGKKFKADWSPKGYLGLPQSGGEKIYTLYWVLLFPLAWWGAVTNHVDGQLGKTEVLGVATPVLVAALIAYVPPLLALV